MRQWYTFLDSIDRNIILTLNTFLYEVFDLKMKAVCVCVLHCNVGISPVYKVVSVSRLGEQYKLISSSLEAD